MSKRFFTPIDFTNTVASAGGAADVLERQAQWDYGDGTLQIGLAGNNVKLSVGQEEVVRAYNGTGSALSIGQAVYVSGAQGQRPSVRLAVAVSDETSSKVLGLVAEAIANGAEGFVTTRGVLKNVDTSSFAEGSKLWLSPTSSGALTASVPSAPNHSVFIGYSLKSNASSGEIFVAPQNGYEIDELHNVLISSPSGSQVLYYDSSSAIWRNTDITNLLPPSAGGSSASIQYSTASLRNTSTTVYQNPTGMTGITLAASVLYKYEISILYRVISTNQIFKCRLNHPAFTVGTAHVVIGTNTTQVSYLALEKTLTGTQTTMDSTTTTNAGAGLLHQKVDGFILTASSGVLSYEFAPTSAGTGADVFENSFMLVTPVTAV